MVSQTMYLYLHEWQTMYKLGKLVLLDDTTT